MNPSTFRRLHSSIQAALRKRRSDEELLSTLCEILARYVPKRFFRGLTKKLIEADVDALVVQVRAIVAKQPISRGVRTLYFGLFDAIYEGSDVPAAGFYVSGVRRFDPADPDTLCRPAYFPEDRFLRSSVLDYVSAFAQKARQSTHRDALSYAAMLAMSAYLVRRIDHQVSFERQLVSGFDDGDIVVIK